MSVIRQITLAGGAQESSFSRTDLCVCGYFLEFGLPALGKTLNTVYKFQCVGLYRAMFQYSFAKVTKLTVRLHVKKSN